MLTLVFSVASIIAGAFTAYFGSGKSRVIGAVLIAIGAVVFILFLGWAGLLPIGFEPVFSGVVINGILAVIGAIIGGLIALGIFLVAIMKA
jgi:predicted acyltransferase